MRLWGLAFSALLTACAAQGPSLRDSLESAEQETSLEQACPEEANLVPICGREACAFYRVEDLVPGHAVLARGAAVFTPPGAGSAMRWWGGAQELPQDREPVFIIPWRQPPQSEISPALRAMTEAWAREWARCPKEKHHILSQAFEWWFVRQGIQTRVSPFQSIHKYTIELLVEDHRRIHRGANGGPWNDAWDEYIKAHPKATEEEIFRYAGELLYRFGLFGPVVPYYSGRTRPLCSDSTAK